MDPVAHLREDLAHSIVAENEIGRIVHTPVYQPWAVRAQPKADKLLSHFDCLSASDLRQWAELFLEAADWVDATDPRPADER